jgi:glycosyltransferase involved in cell wall biosynthesis
MNVVVVTGICVERDAISGAAAGQAEMIASLPGVDDVTLIAQLIDRPLAVRGVSAGSSWDLMRFQEIEAADVVIFHWGIRYDLFEALPLIAAERRTVVHFHNLTPKHLVAEEDRGVIEYSEIQFQLAALAGSELWADSEHNVDCLVQWGFERDRTRVMPFPIERPSPPTVGTSPPERVRLLCVGRLVPAKGVHDLVAAMPLVARELDGRVELTLVGATQLSASAYAEQIVGAIDGYRLRDAVRLVPDVDDEGLWRLYDEADIVVSPSYHEGLCVPIVEGYLSGCRAVGTDAGNLPYVVQAPDPIVPVGDPEALADAIVVLAREILAGTSVDPPGAAALTARFSRERVCADLQLALFS